MIVLASTRVPASVLAAVALLSVGACTSDDPDGLEQAEATATTSERCLGLEGQVDALVFVAPEGLADRTDGMVDEVRHIDGIESVTLLDPDETWTAIESAAGARPGSKPEFSPAAFVLALDDDADHARVGEALSDLDWYEGGFLRPAPDRDLAFRPGRWSESDFVIFFDPNTDDATIDAVRAEVEARPEVGSVRYLDQAAAYDEFVELFADSPELVATVSPEVLPASLRVLVQEDDLNGVQELVSTFEGASGVRDVVVDPALVERTFGLTEALSGC